MIFLAIFLSLIWISNSTPLSKRMIDLTYVLDETIPYLENTTRFKMEYSYNQTVDGIWLQFEDIFSSTHSGTHMDAPAHVIEDGETIDQIPVSDFIAPAAVIDITDKTEQNPEAEATIDDLLNWEAVSGQTLNDSVVLLRSGWGQKWHNSTAFFGFDGKTYRFPRFSGESCAWLVNQRHVKGIGTETVSADIRSPTAPHYPCHQYILGHGHFILENVANMDKLPIYGIKLYAFPMKIGKAGGAPTRVVAEILNI